MNASRQTFAVIVLLNLLWAPVNLVISSATGTGFSPLALGLLRWTTISIILVLLLQLKAFRGVTNYKSMPVREWMKSLAPGILLFGPAHLLYYMSMSLTSELEGTVLLTTSPLWTAVFGFFVLKEDMPSRRWVAIFLSMMGAYVVTVGFQLPALMGHTKGNLMFGGAVVLESLMGVFAASIARRNSGIGTLCGQMWGGAIAFIIAAIALPNALPFAAPSISFANYWPLLYLIFFSGIIAFVVWYRIVEMLPLTLMVLSMAIQPPAAALLGWMFKGQVPSFNTVIGALIIMAALSLGYWGKPKESVLNVDPPGPAG